MCKKLLSLIFILFISSFIFGITKKGKKYKIETGLSERIRTEDWDNIIDYNSLHNDLRHQWRFRTRLWTNINLNNKVSFHITLNDETRKITKRPSKPFKIDEVIFETAYVEINFSKKFKLRFGRQNIMKGCGFIFFDGTPLDGSRTAYFNAFDFTFNYNKKRKIEFITILDPATEKFLPVIDDKKKPLVEWDEKGAGFYLTDKNLKDISIEGYYFYKIEDNDKLGLEPEKRINTLGSRIIYRFYKNYSLTGEFAYEFGDKNPDIDIRSWGGYLFLKRNFDVKWKPYLLFGIIGMSGDNPYTKDDESWDPLFSRWPLWSELYIYSMIFEKGVAYWTNIKMIKAEVVFHPLKKIKGRLTYYHMNSFYPFNSGNPEIFGNGTTRGDLFQGRLDFKLSENFKGHILFEDLLPGNFYKNSNSGYFFRFEINYTIKKVFSW